MTSKRATATDRYDYVIIGGGSSGSVVGGRLAAAGASVLLLEAGPDDRRLAVVIPAMMRRSYVGRNWMYQAEPDASRNGKLQQWSAGKSLGGGGAINGMVFVRGHASDYDNWAAAGCSGWDHQSVLPAFKRMERWIGGESATRGGSGPIAVSYQGVQHPSIDGFIGAARQQGHEFNDDYNGDLQEGVSISQVNQRRGLRSHASREYLRRLHHSGDLTVRTNALVHRILFDGKRAVGVEFQSNGRLEVIRPREEVILSAGSISSPKLLMLSGIGPRAELDAHGIALVQDVPGVGKNLHDHCSTPINYKTPLQTVNDLGVVDAVKAALSFVRSGSGAIAISPMQAQLFQRLRPGSPSPDLQTSLCSFAVQRSVDASGKAEAGLSKTAGINVWTINLHPRSRGSIRLRSADPTDSPIIEHQLLPYDDLEFMLDAIERTQDLMARPAIADMVSGLFDSEAACTTRADWTEWLKSNTTYGIHQVGTCKMGGGDDAVVDPELRVRDVTGLRVVDASIIPSIPSGNTNAAAMMIGERAAEFLLR